MNILFVTLLCGVVLIAAYRFYGRFLTRKVFRLDDANITPAQTVNDGMDFVPAGKGVLFGQHFSAIAAAGPITGPILAAVMFGWVPALVWVLLGSIFIGGVHDMGSLVASIRNKAKSITEVIRQKVSHRAWILFMIFIWITLVYVIVAFTDTTAASFVGDVVLENGETVKGAGIASSSIMYLILPVAMGFLIRFARLRAGIAIMIFLPLAGVAIWAGQHLPVALPVDDALTAQKVWGVLILLYCIVAGIVPVWALLQPRGALGGWFLYIALFVAAAGLIFGGFTVQYPAFTNMADGVWGRNFWIPMFPVLFITVACGACSGFHSLISSGTSSKQLRKESDAKSIGYGAMLLEAMVAVVAIACVMKLPAGDEILGRAPNFIYATGIGSFMKLLGFSEAFGISLGLMAFTTFVYDTLDVCTRLGRYILEEVTGIRNLWMKITGTVLTAGVPLIFIFQTTVNAAGKAVPAWSMFWGIFGASNQLLAALALIGVAVWLYGEHRQGSRMFLVALIPAAVMFAMSNWSLALAIHRGWVLREGAAIIPFVALVLMMLSVFVAAEAAISLTGAKRRTS